jgi:hypothetical protein
MSEANVWRASCSVIGLKPAIGLVAGRAERLRSRRPSSSPGSQCSPPDSGVALSVEKHTCPTNARGSRNPYRRPQQLVPVLHVFPAVREADELRARVADGRDMRHLGTTSAAWTTVPTQASRGASEPSRRPARAAPCQHCANGPVRRCSNQLAPRAAKRLPSPVVVREDNEG